MCNHGDDLAFGNSLNKLFGRFVSRCTREPGTRNEETRNFF